MSKYQKKKAVQSIERWEETLIEKHAMSIKAKFGGSTEDYEDYTQQLSVFVIERKGKSSFKRSPAKDRQESVVKWIMHKAWKMKVSLMSDRKRTERSMVSLARELMENTESGLVVLEDELLPGAKAENDPTEAWGLAYSVTNAMKRLPSIERQVCRRLMENKKKRQIAKELQIHRSTVHAAIKRIRTLFTDEGLKDFV